MSYFIKYPTPQGANIQIFNAGETNATQSWIKPQGASFVWFTLIGAGGSGDPINSQKGGGSGAVTNCMVPAFLIPDELQIQVGVGGIYANNGKNTLVNYVSSGTYNLLTANGGGTGGGGFASTSNYFSCMGFFQSVAGQNGNSSNQGQSGTTFLSGGSLTGGTVNYGYQTGGDGYFQIQPIILGVGGSSGNDSTTAGIGCGGAYGSTNGGAGGDGLVVIITW
jgi:hypothetical protein